MAENELLYLIQFCREMFLLTSSLSSPSDLEPPSSSSPLFNSAAGLAKMSSLRAFLSVVLFWVSWVEMEEELDGEGEVAVCGRGS